MYLSTKLQARFRALLLASLLATAPAASALAPDTNVSIAGWLQRAITSIFDFGSSLDTEVPCTCDGSGNECGGTIHLPGG